MVGEKSSLSRAASRALIRGVSCDLTPSTSVCDARCWSCACKVRRVHLSQSTSWICSMAVNSSRHSSREQDHWFGQSPELKAEMEPVG